MTEETAEQQQMRKILISKCKSEKEYANTFLKQKLVKSSFFDNITKKQSPFWKKKFIKFYITHKRRGDTF